MKKLLVFDDFMVAIVAALGYGFGYAYSMFLGWPMLVCMLICMASGIILEGIISKIIFSREVQSNRKLRIGIYMLIVLIFMVVHYISLTVMGVSMISGLLEQYVYVIGMPILGFFVNLLIRTWRISRIRKRYADGSGGYVFDLDEKDVDEVNHENQRIYGEYDAECAVKTRTGVYVGVKTRDSYSYLGIPYAKPPVGERRWKAPEPLPSSDAVYEAKNFGASAIQVEHSGSILKHHRQSEDCLTLNIAVNRKTEEKKPVLVVFHHGDFTSGGTVDPLLYGLKFVNKHPDILFVSFNYRLGIFGFIDFTQVPGGQAYPDTLNLGLQDQVAALKWIKENISAFGGDPERISVAGFESGATSIMLLASSGHVRGLFQKAFLFNGTPALAYPAPDASRALAAGLLKETKTTTMEELRNLDTETLKAAAQKLWGYMCSPTCDGKWLPADGNIACQKGAAAGIEFIVGIPAHELHRYHATVGDRNFEDFLAAAVADVQANLDEDTIRQVQAYITEQAATGVPAEAERKVIEQWNALLIYRSALMLSRGGNSVHLFYWDEKPVIEKLGSSTVDVVATLLGNGEALEMYGGLMNPDVAEALQLFLHKFVKGEKLDLYKNEIKGVSAIDWKPLPEGLVVTDSRIKCEMIEDRLTEIDGLLKVARR
ncbi:MAG: carboxylesterase family protein [Clostridia bacterium]|nr:carboxylesterase family protein [Clostridia bacterium]